VPHHYTTAASRRNTFAADTDSIAVTTVRVNL
jgi:hypothetical protein